MNCQNCAETPPDEDAWAEELQARYAAYVRGNAVAIDAAESIRQLREDVQRVRLSPEAQAKVLRDTRHS